MNFKRTKSKFELAEIDQIVFRLEEVEQGSAIIKRDTRRCHVAIFDDSKVSTFSMINYFSIISFIYSIIFDALHFVFVIQNENTSNKRNDQFSLRLNYSYLNTIITKVIELTRGYETPFTSVIVYPVINFVKGLSWKFFSIISSVFANNTSFCYLLDILVNL